MNARRVLEVAAHPKALLGAIRPLQKVPKRTCVALVQPRVLPSLPSSSGMALQVGMCPGNSERGPARPAP